MEDENRAEWISSKELIDATGISRATLNNYILIGILPKPSVQKPDDMPGTSKIGYFPLSALSTVQTVQKLKKRGVRLEEIVRTIGKAGGEGVVTTPADGSRVSGGQCERTDRKGLMDGNRLNLTIDEITVPAYLVNYRFEIDWVNGAAEEQVFMRSIRSTREAEARNVFRLCLGWELTSHVENWESIIDLHMSYLKSRHPSDYLRRMYTGITESEVSLLGNRYDRVALPGPGLMNLTTLTLRQRSGKETMYRVHAAVFREGVLFVYVPDDSAIEGMDEFLGKRETLIRDLLGRRLPTLVPFCVLVADIQDSVRICAELPPEEYFELINSTWRVMAEIFGKYYGIFGKHAGDGIVYFFIKERDSDYIVNALSCAKEVQERMAELSAEWKRRKKWYNELYLNIGVNEGLEYFSTVHASTAIEFTALGDTINYAARISGLARCGSVFTTKNLMNKLSAEEKIGFRFGIHRDVDGREVFIENVFSRVIDLIGPDDPRRTKCMDIAALPVTEIVK